jgi:hypothetical protein
MATIVYLDVEDEITSAAARIRAADQSRVGLVLPFGSRVATSRINFRLLAREALESKRRLDIIAPDASARALAASAGLPVFGSVAEYEQALEGGEAAAGAMAAGVALAAGAAAGAGAAAASGRFEQEDAPPGEDTTVQDGAPAGGGPPPVGPAGDGQRDLPVARPRRRLPVRAIVIALVLVLVLGGAAAAAGYLLLPSAEITLTPQIEPVGPISFDVHADPEATTVDVEAGIIPAQTLTIPVESEGEFPATGKRVERTAATGGVRWSNCDPTSAYTIPAGTVVKTADGVAFSIDEQVFLPVAVLSGTPPNKVTVKCQNSEVAVTATSPGPAGNVDAGTITVVPARYNRSVITVTNPDPTTGGTRTEYTRVKQSDVDAAVEQLTKDIQAEFASELENPSRVPPGTTLFPETAVLSDPVPAVDPSTLVGQEVDSFTLRMTADGTVLAVDPTPVESIAQQRLKEQIDPGYQLVDGSTTVDIGDGEVVAGVVTFPVSGSAKELRPVDEAALKAQVLGLSEEDARAVLAPYGDVTIVLWPGWVHSVPSLEQRVTLTVAAPVDLSPAPAPSVAPSGPPESSAPGSPSPSVAAS